MPAIVASTSITGRNRRVKAPRWAAVMARGKQGGAYGMNLFQAAGLYDNEDQAESNAYHNARNPGSGVPYVVNPNLWCLELLPQLTCCVIHSDDCGTSYAAAGQGWRHRFGGVAITKRHIAGVGHAFIHAQGTWINGNTTNTPPTRRRFMDVNGNAVDRIQLSQAGFPLGADFSIATLDSDLPDSIFIPRVIPSTAFNSQLANWDRLSVSQEWSPNVNEWHAVAQIGSTVQSHIAYRAADPGDYGVGIVIDHVVSGSGSSISVSVAGRTVTVTAGSSATCNAVIAAVNAHAPALALVSAYTISQFDPLLRGTGPIVAGTASTPAFPPRPSDYPIFNRTMAHSFTGPGSYGNDTIPALSYGEWNGDSGAPDFVKVLSELVFSGIVSGADPVGSVGTASSFEQLCNAGIALSDANAIALGRMSTPTGYTVTPFTGPLH